MALAVDSALAPSQPLADASACCCCRERSRKRAP